MEGTRERPVPPTLLIALSSPLPSDPVCKGTSDSSSSSPTPSSTYVVRLSPAEVAPSIPPSPARNSQTLRDSFLPPLTYSPSPLTREANLETQTDTQDSMDRGHSEDGGPDPNDRQLDDIRISEDFSAISTSAVSTYNRDSTTKSSVAGGGGRMSAVSENEGGARRASRPSTFGGRDGAQSIPRDSPSLRGESTPAPNAGRISAVKSDALRRQSMRSSRQSRDTGVRVPSSEKEALARASEDDGNGRPVSGSYRIEFQTTGEGASEGANGDTAYASSTGHSDKKYEIPRSSYYVGPPAVGSAFGTEPKGTIGTHYPREIVRVERDYSGGELVQFHPTYPLEFEGRITPTKFQASINEINEVLISAYSLRRSALENVMGVATLYLWTLLTESHYDKEMRRLAQMFDRLNKDLYNPAGLNLLWPRKVGFLFLEIEYY